MEASTGPLSSSGEAGERTENRFREVIEEVDVAAEEILTLLAHVRPEFSDIAAAALVVRSELFANIASRVTEFPVQALQFGDVSTRPQVAPLLEPGGADGDFGLDYWGVPVV